MRDPVDGVGAAQAVDGDLDDRGTEDVVGERPSLLAVAVVVDLRGVRSGPGPTG